MPRLYSGFPGRAPGAGYCCCEWRLVEPSWPRVASLRFRMARARTRQCRSLPARARKWRLSYFRLLDSDCCRMLAILAASVTCFSLVSLPSAQLRVILLASIWLSLP